MSETLIIHFTIKLHLQSTGFALLLDHELRLQSVLHSVLGIIRRPSKTAPNILNSCPQDGSYKGQNIVLNPSQLHLYKEQQYSLQNSLTYANINPSTSSQSILMRLNNTFTCNKLTHNHICPCKWVS